MSFLKKTFIIPYKRKYRFSTFDNILQMAACVEKDTFTS